jgi:hypothetical protein
MSIFVGGAGRVKQTIEGLAADAFLPGTLLTRTVVGGNDTLATSADADTVFGNEFLIGDDQDQTKGGGEDKAVTVGDNVKSINVLPGDLVKLRIAATQNITRKGVALASNGDGTFKIAATDGTDRVFAVSEEIVNVTTAGTLVLARAI